MQKLFSYTSIRRLWVVFGGQPAAGGHHGGGDEEEWRQPLAEQQERQGGADEGGKGVVGAGASGADGALGVGVAVDTQAVGHETEQQQDGDVFRHWETLVDGQRNAEGHGIGRGQDGGAWGCDAVGNFS